MTDLRATFDAIDATWPAAAMVDVGGWRVRRGDGGGGRVSTATLLGPAPGDMAAMEAQHAAFGQPARVMVRPFDTDLDADLDTDLDGALDARGYGPPDPTSLLSAPVAALATEPKRLTAFLVDWPPLAYQREMWEDHGIGPARQAVMDRCATPKITLLGRASDTPAGAAFLAAAKGVAMVHALVVLPGARRQGTARAMMQAAAQWARAQGADQISVQVDARNTAALAFYAALGFAEHGRYHYRVRTGEPPA